MIQHAQAAFAVQQGLYRNVVQLSGGRVVQTEALEPQSMNKESNATTATANLSAMQSQEFAERHLSAIRNFLTINAALFPLYQEWVETNQPDPQEDYPFTAGRRTGGKVLNL